MLKKLNSDIEIPNFNEEIPMKKFQILIETKISIYSVISTKEK
jgi:hypothetical protein